MNNAGSSRKAQLPLPLLTAPQLEFAHFHGGANGEAVTAVMRWSERLGPETVYLWGPASTGKTHLLQAAIRAAGERGARAMYVPLGDDALVGADVLDGLDALDFIALDDIENCLGDARKEEKLFNLFNRLQSMRGRLLWAGSRGPRQHACRLPDLASRLTVSLAYQLIALDERSKAAVICAAAERRGLNLSDPVVSYIMRRERRDLAALMALLDDLDQASLAHGRAITVPFVREILDNRVSAEPNEC